MSRLVRPKVVLILGLYSALFATTKLMVQQASSQSLLPPSLPPLAYMSYPSQTSSVARGLIAVTDLDGGGSADIAMITRPPNLTGFWALVVLSAETGDELVLMYPPNGGSFFSVGNYDDINGDGIGELISTTSVVGITFFTFHIHDGATLQIISSVAPTPFSFENWNIIHDVDGDSLRDVAVVASVGTLMAPNGPGALLIFNPLYGSWIYYGSPIIAGQFGGSFVQPMGDMDGNGQDEIGVSYGSSGVPTALSIFNVGPGFITLRGTIHVVSQTAYAVIHDVSGDGLPDIAMKDSSQPTGEIDVYSGLSLTQVATLHIPAGGTAAVGARLVSIPDLDGDETPEFAFLAVLAAPGTNNLTGACFVFCGRMLTPKFVMSTPAGLSLIGAVSPMTSILSLEDMNNDGFPEIAIPTGGVPPPVLLGLTEITIYSGRGIFHPIVSAGTVSDASGTTLSTLRTQVGMNSPTDGGPRRTVLANVGDMVKLYVERPPLHAFPTARFAIFAQVGEGPYSSAFALPSGAGVMSIPTPFSQPGDPSLILVSSSFPGLPGLVPTVPAFQFAPGTLAANLGVVPFPVTAVFQCLIEDTNHPGLPLSTSNAVRLIVD